MRPWTCGRTATPVGGRPAGEVEQLAPLVGVGVVLEQGERDRPADRRATAGASSRPRARGRRGPRRATPAGASSNTPVPSSPSTAPMPNSSSSAANVPGHRLAVDGPVGDGARRREPERAGRDAVAHDGGHRLDVRRAWRARCARRARPSRRPAPRRAGPGCRRRRRAAWASRASRYSGKVSQPQRMPSDRAAPGMSSTPSISPISQSCWSGGDGREARRRSCPSRRW